MLVAHNVGIMRRHRRDKGVNRIGRGHHPAWPLARKLKVDAAESVELRDCELERGMRFTFDNDGEQLMIKWVRCVEGMMKLEHGKGERHLLDRAVLVHTNEHRVRFRVTVRVADM